MNDYKKDAYYKEGHTENSNCDICGFEIKYNRVGISQSRTKKRVCLVKQKIAAIHKQILNCEENDENTKPKVALSVDNQFFATKEFEDLQEDHKCLLEVFFDEECYEEKSLPKLKSMNKVKFVIIETIEELDLMSNELIKCTEIAVNLEYYSQRSYLGFTWLLQICTEETYYMINCLKLQKELHILNTIFMDLGIMKIFHDAEDAVLRLYKDFAIFVVNMFDTSMLNKIIMESKEKDLLPKDISFEPSQIHTHFLIFFKTHLINSSIKLHKNKFLKTMRHNCEKICRRVHHKIIYNKTNFKIDDKATNRERYVITELLKWRDDVAQKEDEPPNFILPDNDIIKIANELFHGDSITLSNCYGAQFLHNPETYSTYFNITDVVMQARRIGNGRKKLQCLSNVPNQETIEGELDFKDTENHDKHLRKIRDQQRKKQLLKRIPRFR